MKRILMLGSGLLVGLMMCFSAAHAGERHGYTDHGMLASALVQDHAGYQAAGPGPALVAERAAIAVQRWSLSNTDDQVLAGMMVSGAGLVFKGIADQVAESRDRTIS